MSPRLRSPDFLGRRSIRSYEGTEHLERLRHTITSALDSARPADGLATDEYRMTAHVHAG
jgi:hypothetical protein